MGELFNFIFLICGTIEDITSGEKVLKYASLPLDGPFLGMQFLNNNALSNALNNANTAFFVNHTN